MTESILADHLGPLDGFHDDRRHSERSEFREAVLSGLGQAPKAVSCKYFYDEEGSRLFERICELPEYYPTRTELGILQAHAADMARAIGRDAVLVEFGSGASVKVRLLLDALTAPQAYIPVDISREHLLASASALAADYPALTVVPVCADYTAGFPLPEAAAGAAPVAFFPGSTIGNFDPGEARAFLGRVARLVGPGGGLLIGVDLKKDTAILHAAYNDSAGVTAAFNLNLLKRINRELDGDFDLARFEHRAVYDPGKGRIEMHIASRETQTVRVDGHRFAFAADETIHTENSYKYGIAGFHALASEAGFEARNVWTDPAHLFSVHYLVAR